MYRLVTALGVLLLASPVVAGDFDSGSDGTDGALDCAALFALNPECGVACDQGCTVQIDLALAADASWDTPSPDPGKGVYDADEWAVVYKYTTIDIPPFVTVTFVNHLKGAPVVWLASENVTIAGTVELNGADGSQAEGSSYAIPGPGGFSGGNGGLGGSAGFGPGGGEFGSGFGPTGGGGGYGCPGAVEGGSSGVMYGTPSIVPLIGGSGGGAFHFNAAVGGGAGGGAVLIASSGSISLPDSEGGISAKGGGGISGGGSGSGGGIRLIANVVSGMGLLRAVGGTAGNDGGCGRIRVEAPDPDNNIDLDDKGIPQFTTGEPPEFVFPPPNMPGPILRVKSLTVTPMIEKSVPTDPLATVATDDVAFAAASGVAVTINIEALNFPEGEGMIVNVRIVQADGGLSFDEPSSMLEDPDDDGILTAIAGFVFGDFDPGKWEVQLTVLLP